MKKKALLNFFIGGSSAKITWGQMSALVTDNGDGTLNLPSITNGGGTAIAKLRGVGSYAQMIRPASGADTVILGVTSVDDAGYVNGSQSGIFSGIFEFAANYTYYNNNTSTSAARTPVTGDIIRIVRVSESTLVLRISSNGGSSFTDITTFTGNYTGLPLLTVKGIGAATAANGKLNLGFIFNT